MEAATRSATGSRGPSQSPSPSEADTELALRLGSVMIHCFGGRGGDVLKVIDESGLTFIQMKALVTLQDPEASSTVTALSATLGISPPSASRAADGLVKNGLATRVEDPVDRRVRRVTLSRRGRELADRILSARLAGLEDFAASLTVPQRKKLETALDALLKRDEIAEIYRNHERRLRR
jgi:DNA-binding MarR family transcriptional regulator